MCTTLLFIFSYHQRDTHWFPLYLLKKQSPLYQTNMRPLTYCSDESLIVGPGYFCCFFFFFKCMQTTNAVAQQNMKLSAPCTHASIQQGECTRKALQISSGLCLGYLQILIAPPAVFHMNQALYPTKGFIAPQITWGKCLTSA